MTQIASVMARLGVPPDGAAVAIGGRFQSGRGARFSARSAIDGVTLEKFVAASAADIEQVIEAAEGAFVQLCKIPAPLRGEFVRKLGMAFRQHKAELAQIISWEVGKITQEALGEVQEVIDICDFAVGLSRQLYGKTMPSERPEHRLTELWHPLGPVAVITAFNFPVAVWAWNAAIALVAGDPVIWKPSEKAPLCALAVHGIVGSVLEQSPEIPDAALSLVLSDAEGGKVLAASAKVPLVSATGSVRMGQQLGQVVASRLGRSLLELGGNNAMIVTPSADLELALRSIVFAAVGTAGQRCTSLRRLIVHRSVLPVLLARLQAVYPKLRIGDPRQEGVLIGPLIDEQAYLGMQKALVQAASQGGKVFGGQRKLDGVPAGGFYVEPALVEIDPSAAIVREETFAPILYVMAYDTLDDAIAIHNAVPQGLASSIFTNDVREAERFCSATGSDCGIVNVNIGTSGAEIGGAFGGEKATGGGRESGSDSWQAYMRRVTSTVNYSHALPLAQGIRFDID